MCGFYFVLFFLNLSVFLIVEGMFKNKFCKGDILFSFCLLRLDIMRSGWFLKKNEINKSNSCRFVFWWKYVKKVMVCVWERKEERYYFWWVKSCIMWVVLCFMFIDKGVMFGLYIKNEIVVYFWLVKY